MIAFIVIIIFFITTIKCYIWFKREFLKQLLFLFSFNLSFICKQTNLHLVYFDIFEKCKSIFVLSFIYFLYKNKILLEM